MVTHINRPRPRTPVTSSLRLGRGVMTAVALAAALAGPAHAQSGSPPTDLGTLGGPSSQAYGINDAAQVVGGSTPAASYHPFLWTAAGGMEDLGTLEGYPYAFALGINNAGQVVGRSGIPPHAFLWAAYSGMVDLGTLGGSTSIAAGINDAGQVVGWSVNVGSAIRAFVWTAADGMSDVGTLGGDNSRAYGINTAGQVVGESEGADHISYAFLWNAGGGMVKLGNPYSVARGINDAGQVVGSEPNGHGFLWTAAGGMIDLGTLGGTYSAAYGINNAGQVVGESSTASGEVHAFFWTVADGMVDLGTLGGGYSWANGINNAGQVAGYSRTASGEFHAALWSLCFPSPPVIANASATPSVLWPPNHQMIRVRVDYTVTTSCDATATTALSVVSNEPDNGRGDGNSSGDAVVVDDHTVLLRAERAGPGDGRTYTIRIRSTDSEGHQSTATRTVSVPKSMRKP
jgi:probable HAF family extracellular repeat protein